MPPGARTIEQIYASLGSVYDPQANNIRARQAELPNQLAVDEQQLNAKRTQAYDDITSGAQKRGMFFSGFPLQEQAKYADQYYTPELARMRGSYRTNALSLEDAIAQINERRSGQAQSIFTNERDYYENVRQNELARAEAARGRASAAASAAPDFSGISSMLQQMATGGGQDQSAERQRAVNALTGLFNTKNVATVANTIKAIQESARRGDPYDKIKLELIAMYQKNPNNTYAAQSDLIKRALAYKAPAPAQKAPGYTPPTNFAFPVNPLALKR